MTTFAIMGENGCAEGLDPQQQLAAAGLYGSYSEDIRRGRSLDGFDEYYAIRRVHLGSPAQRMFIVFNERAYPLFFDKPANYKWRPLLIDGVIILKNSRGRKPSIAWIASTNGAAGAIWEVLDESISVQALEQIR